MHNYSKFHKTKLVSDVEYLFESDSVYFRMRKIEREILLITLQDHTRNAEIRKRTQIISHKHARNKMGMGSTCSQARSKLLGACNNRMGPTRGGSRRPDSPQTRWTTT